MRTFKKLATLAVCVLTASFSMPALASSGASTGTQAKPRPISVADINRDGTVNAFDMIAIFQAWGACPTDPCAADLDHDGVVGVSDLLIVLANWS